MRINFILKCTECGEENYLTEKNKRNTPDRLEQKNIVHVAKKQPYTKKKLKSSKNTLEILECFSFSTKKS